MDETKKLKRDFQTTEIKFGKEILKYISTKTDNNILFPPYIPFIGKNFNKFRILFYSTAQNISFNKFQKSYQNNFSKLIDRLYYFNDFKKRYPDNEMTFEDIAINPYKTGVIASLLGVFIYAMYNKTIENLNDINNLISISNYYKFSLKSKNKDINPETSLKKISGIKKKLLIIGL